MKKVVLFFIVMSFASMVYSQNEVRQEFKDGKNKYQEVNKNENVVVDPRIKNLKGILAVEHLTEEGGGFTRVSTKSACTILYSDGKALYTLTIKSNNDENFHATDGGVMSEYQFRNLVVDKTSVQTKIIGCKDWLRN